MSAEAELPAGYAALEKRYGLAAIPNWHRSYVASVGSGNLRDVSPTGKVEETYSLSYWPGETLGDHLEFALKYDGTNLGILAALFEKIDPAELIAYIKSKPTGKYTRRIWFLYEFLVGKRLPLEDVKKGNYIDLLEPSEYYAVTPALKVRRQRINNNLLGNRSFCPTIRRTETIRAFEAANLPDRCQSVVAQFTPDQIKRALSYLYTKETKSSFEIEHIKPSSTRVERFVSLLQSAEAEDFCEKERLIELQNQIVDPRYCESDYRTIQNYVGESIAQFREKVHYVCPKPDDVPDLMQGLVAAHQNFLKSDVSAVAHAAAIAYAFVFIHPFQDGNGRIHRFLIHNILARGRFTPPGLMFPVSAVMVTQPAEYNASLEAFSRPLIKLVDYSLDSEGQMKVQTDTVKWYRYIDMTTQVETLFRFIEQTIQTELVAELTFLANYDNAKKAIQEIVDLPDRLIDLLIRCCLQNNGRLSGAKRDSHFNKLSEDEITHLEQAIQTIYGIQ